MGNAPLIYIATVLLQGRPAKYMGHVPNFNLCPNYRRNNITKAYFIATSIK